MRIVVTGGCGFIGSRVVGRLAALGHDTTVLDKVPSKSNQPSIRASVLERDEMASAIEGADTVIHLAGTLHDPMRRDPYGAAMLELQGTLNVLEAAARTGTRHIVYASSFYVYDGIAASETVDEETPLDLRRMGLFGATKTMGEALCRSYKSLHGLTFSILRFGCAYGPGGSSVVRDFLRSAIEGQPIEIWGRGQRGNQYTFVDDIADGVVAALGARNETYNLIAPEITTTAELAELIVGEGSVGIVFDTQRAEGPSFAYMSSRKAVGELAWSCTPLSEGLRRSLGAMLEATEPAPTPL